jgi:hypothetical protein
MMMMMMMIIIIIINPDVKTAPGKKEVENFWREIYGKIFHIMKKRA